MCIHMQFIIIVIDAVGCWVQKGKKVQFVSLGKQMWSHKMVIHNSYTVLCTQTNIASITSFIRPASANIWILIDQFREATKLKNKPLRRPTSCTSIPQNVETHMSSVRNSGLIRARRGMRILALQSMPSKYRWKKRSSRSHIGVTQIRTRKIVIIFNVCHKMVTRASAACTSANCTAYLRSDERRLAGPGSCENAKREEKTR